MKMVLGLSLLLIGQDAFAGNIWEHLFKKLKRHPNGITLTAKIQARPLSIQPGKANFYGVIKIPQYVSVTQGSIKTQSNAAQITFDNSIVCYYSPSTIISRTLSFRGCSDGSRYGDELSVAESITLTLNTTLGKYFIEVQAPGHQVGYHQAKLVVVNTGVDALFGTSNLLNYH